MTKTTIGWTNEVWNPVVGCSKVSEGCRHCYAERWAMDKGFTPKGVFWTAPNAEKVVSLKPERLEQPLHLKAPRMIFVNSMSDAFHELVPFEFLDQMWAIMKRCPQHIFQILTKRPGRMLEYTREREVLPNVWLGTSIEDNKSVAKRLPLLVEVPAKVHFVSAEPLLEIPTGLYGYMDKLQWVIVGGESGVLGCRPMPPGAPAYVRDLCRQFEVPFFFKQWGGYPDKLDGEKALLSGKLYQEYPALPPKPEPEAKPTQMKLF